MYAPYRSGDEHGSGDVPHHSEDEHEGDELHAHLSIPPIPLAITVGVAISIIVIIIVVMAVIKYYEDKKGHSRDGQNRKRRKNETIPVTRVNDEQAGHRTDSRHPTFLETQV